MSKKSTEEKGKKAAKSAKKVELEKLAPAPEVKEVMVAAPETKKKKKESSPKKEASKKVPAKKSVPKAAPKGSGKASSRKKVAQPTGDDIALRAYFIAERRQALGLPGDSTGDWVEAERQLLEEAGLKK